MAADVLFTGTDDDLDWRDGWADSSTSLALSAQQIETALLTSQGEWLTDAYAGIPWPTYLTQKRVSTEQIRKDVLEALTTVPDVTAESVTVEKTGRTLSVVVRVRRLGQTFVGTVSIDPSRDKLGNNGYLAAFFPQIMVPKIFSR